VLRKVVAFLVVAGQILIASPASVSADPGKPPIPTPVVGSSVQPFGGIPGKGAADHAYVIAKRAMADEYAAARLGNLPMATFTADQRAFEARWYGPSPQAPWASRPQPVSGASGGAKPLAEPASACCWSHDLAVVQAPQQDRTYCGPGAAYSLLAYLGYSTSHDGESLNQSCIGGNCGSGSPNSQKYLETNLWGNTPWYVSANDWPVPGTLNYWRTGSYSGFYVADLPNSEHVLRIGAHV
jgi:hypothetical protein